MSQIFSTGAPLVEEQSVGAVLIGVHATSTKTWYFYHATDSYVLPTGAVSIISGAWNWAELKSLVPSTQWAKIAEATYPIVEIIEGLPVTMQRRVKISGVPTGAIVSGTDLPPHHWFGE